MSNLDKDRFETERQSRLEALFGNVPLESEITVKLPSLGKFYGNGIPTVNLTPVKFEDEKQLSSNLKNKLNPINLLMSKCVKGIDINNMLLLDKLYLLLKIREISYGQNYPAIITCPKCINKSEVNIDLANLVVKSIPEDLQDPREITLPKLKKIVKVRFPRVSDETYLMTQEQTYNNLWRFVIAVDGVDDPVFIAKAIPKMHIMDIKFIISNIMRQDLGLDPRFIYECSECSEQSEMAVPINENFFSVT